MIKIYPNLYVGNETDCHPPFARNWAIVHACKYPCFHGKVGKVTPDHPNYLYHEDKANLYLNIIDPPKPLFKLETFTQFLEFTHHYWRTGSDVLIHCNQGESRAPSLALVYLASLTGVITNASYDQATKEFTKLYPKYKPGQGIQTFLREHWLDLMAH